jgi:signal transduction histidine kinase
VLSAELLRASHVDPEMTETAENISTSAAAMSQLVSDLLDFTTGALGGTMRISPAAMNLQTVCTEVADELNAAHPTRSLTCKCEGDCTGVWDPLRMRQLIGNLVGNALQHGEGSGPVRITVAGDATEVRLSVHNRGRPIPRTLLSIRRASLVSSRRPASAV